MKKYFLIAFCIFSFGQALKAQVCLDSNIVLTSQAQVDSFKILFPDCTILPGDFEIEFADITNFDSMSHIIEVHGRLKLSVNDSLRSLRGFNNITRIGILDLRSNDAIKDLSELSSLDSLGGINFVLNGLESLKGLEQIEYIGFVNINNNHSLVNYNGLSGLIGVEFSFNNIRCNNLEDISMPNLKYVKNIMRFDFMEKLTSLAGLENLESARYFGVTKSPVLTDISAIENLTVNILEFIENPSLTSCATEMVCRHISADDALFRDNGVGCDSTSVVEMACTALSTKPIQNSSLISVYPNPSFGKIQIDTEDVQIDQIEIFNSFGQLMLSTAFTSSLDLSGISKGYYLMVLSGDDGRFLEKVVVH
jgi:hypothetical protein